MKKRLSSLVILLGILLILASLGLTLLSQMQIGRGKQEAAQTVSEINALLPERTQGSPMQYHYEDMPAVEIDGTDYIGILELPSFGICLPVSYAWQEKDLHCAPSRFCGSVYGQGLVIGGDYFGQFEFCDKIELGALVSFTDLGGAQFRYTVSRVDRRETPDAQWLTEGDFDLTLFCKAAYSAEYIAVRCIFNPKNS